MIKLPNLGLPELGIIVVLALIIFGPGKLPDVGRAIGKSLREFKSASKEVKDQTEKMIVEGERS